MRTNAICSAIVISAAFLGTTLILTPAKSSDDIISLDIAKAMATPDAQANMDGSVKFYFGNAPHPTVVKQLGEGITNKKANGVGRNSTKGCDRAFLNGLIQLQQRAKDLGGNAVININSYYKKIEVVSNTTVECHSGLLMDGVALKGEIVTINP